MKLKFVIASALVVFSASTFAGPTSTVMEDFSSRFDEGTCYSNCNMVADYGDVRFWYFVDGEGQMHLDYREELAESKISGRGEPTPVYFKSVRQDDAAAKFVMERCGKDGWGWNDSEQINATNYGTFSVYTNYTHAGIAIRVTINNDTGDIIGNPVSVDSGIKAGTPLMCGEKRDAVQQK